MASFIVTARAQMDDVPDAVFGRNIQEHFALLQHLDGVTRHEKNPLDSAKRWRKHLAFIEVEFN